MDVGVVKILPLKLSTGEICVANLGVRVIMLSMKFATSLLACVRKLKWLLTKPLSRYRVTK